MKNSEIKISEPRLEKYTNFLNAFATASINREKNFITLLVRNHGIAAPTVGVLRDIGLISNTRGSWGYSIHYDLPVEPIVVRRVLIGLFYYNKIRTQNRVNKIYHNKERDTTRLNALVNGKETLENIIPVQKPKRKYTRTAKIHKQDTVEIKVFGIPWYKCVKTGCSIKITICWIPIWHKKINK